MRIPPVGRRRERGFVAVVVMVTILAVLMIYTTANVRTLVQLQNELKLLEQRQTQRLAKGSGSPALEMGTTAVSPGPGKEAER